MQRFFAICRKATAALGVFCMLTFSGCSFSSAGAIGVIGGADGPTAVFVTSKYNNAALFWGGVAVLALGVAGYFLWRRRHK